MSPSTPFLSLLSAGFAARTGAWIQRIQRDAAVTEPDATAESGCRLVRTRAEFDSAISTVIAESRPLGRDFAVAVFDIDHLAHANEDHGFEAGDALIAQVEVELVTELREGDVVHSLGCGSWLVLLPELAAVDTHQFVDALRDHVERRLVVHFATNQVGTLSLATISAGTLASEAAALDASDLLLAASQATLVSKLHGGNRTSSWGETTQQFVSRSAERRRAQRDAQLSTALSLAEALDLRDAETSNHSNMVARYAELMAAELGFSPEHVRRVRVAGLLHDIGKIGVPDSVLRKPAKLDEDEWVMMQAHPNIGARLLASIDAEDIRSWVLAHHERPDGKGYPLGLTADDIPLEAKILAVADAYEAMTVDRVYREAPGPEVARQELDRLRGMQFDSDIVTLFIGILDRMSGEDGTIAAPAAEPTRFDRRASDGHAG